MSSPINSKGVQSLISRPIFYIVISFLIIFTASFILEINYAEARGDTEPCSYRMPHSFLKISNDPWTCEKVDYWVPEKCGIYAGLYKTDKQLSLIHI